jgi:phage terminase large subunit
MFIVSGREIQKSIKESAKKLFIDTIHRYGLDDQFTILETEITHKITGARLIFLGLKSNPEAIKGLEGCNILWNEEADRISEESWELIIPTVFRNSNAQIWCTYNPQLPSDFVEKLLKDPECVSEHINYTENPFCTPEFIAEAEKMREENPAKYNWIYLGGYRPEGADTYIPLSLVMDAINRPPQLIDPRYEIVAGLDLGFYQDRTVLAIRHGVNILDIKIWNSPDVNALVPEIVGMMSRHRITRLGIDALGPGAPVIQMIQPLLPGRIFPVKYSEKSESREFKNKRTEAWGKTKELLNTGHLPSGYDNDLISDLCNLRYTYSSDGRIELETKKQLVSRGFRSCDIADAIGISLVIPDEMARTPRVTRSAEHNSPRDWTGI